MKICAYHIWLGVVLMMLGACKKPEVKVELVRVVDQSNKLWDKTNDYGGTLTQTYSAGMDADVVAVRVAIEARENTRELLVTLRNVDEYGYPKGEVLASGVVDVVAKDNAEVVWHEVTFDHPYHQEVGENLCLSLTPSSIKSEDYGYFEYAFSYKNKYTEGRLNSGSRSRRIPSDDGKDLCFEIIVLAEEGEHVEPLAPPQDDALKGEGGEVSSEKLTRKVEKYDLPYKRFTEFLRVKHIPIRDMEGRKVSMWKYTRGQKYREPLLTTEVDSPVVDIFYGVDSVAGDKELCFLVHEVGVNGGGGTSYSHGFGSIQYLNVDLDNLPVGKPIKLAQNVKPKSERSFIWIQIDRPEGK